ncbi:MAG: hypothetical protein ABI240_11130 [Sphingomonas sp.]
MPGSTKLQRRPLPLVAGAHVYEDKQPSSRLPIHAGNAAPGPSKAAHNLFGAKVVGTGYGTSSIDARLGLHF